MSKQKINIIWFNPTCDRNVKTNVGKEFLTPVKKSFPPEHKLHKILNQYTIKISITCMPNVRSIIEADNKKKLRKAIMETERKCSCPKNIECSLNKQCLSKTIIYQATVECENNQEMGLMATDFKSQLVSYKASFKSSAKRNAIELSKYIWQLKYKNTDYSIK